MFKYFLITIVIIVLAAVIPVFAVENAPELISGGNAEIEDITGFNNIQNLASKIVEFVLVAIASPIIIGAAIYSGYLFMTFGGNPEKLIIARRSLTYALIGAIIVAVALGAAEVVKMFYKRT